MLFAAALIARKHRFELFLIRFLFRVRTLFGLLFGCTSSNMQHAETAASTKFLRRRFLENTCTNEQPNSKTSKHYSFCVKTTSEILNFWIFHFSFRCEYFREYFLYMHWNANQIAKSVVSHRWKREMERKRRDDVLVLCLHSIKLRFSFSHDNWKS